MGKSLALATLRLLEPDGQQCYRCVLGFEAAVLAMFCLANLIAYLFALYQICRRARSNVADSCRTPPIDRAAVDYKRELAQTLTSGLWLFTVLLCFAALTLLLITATLRPGNQALATSLLVFWNY